jgi:predicted negative regulator of RcsB-dependent stress response
VEDYLSEKEQWEWVKAQLRENGPAVIVAIALAVAIVSGWRWWQGHLDAGRLEAGAKYMQMVQALESGNRTQAMVSLGELEREHAGSPYTDQAKLLAARLYVDEGALDKAAGELASVAEHSKDPELVLVARLRLARVQIAQGKADSALATLDAAPSGAFAGRFHQVRGDAYYAKGDKPAALREYQAAQQQPSDGADALLRLKVADLAADAPSTTPPTRASVNSVPPASSAASAAPASNK